MPEVYLWFIGLTSYGRDGYDASWLSGSWHEAYLFEQEERYDVQIVSCEVNDA